MEDLSQWLVQLRKGVVELLVLRLLALKGELHGYAIVKELNSIGRLVAGESTVYPVLKRLASDGLVTSRWVEGGAVEGGSGVEAGAGPPRKYYRISDLGSAFLTDATAEWDALVDSLNTLKGEGND